MKYVALLLILAAPVFAQTNTTITNLGTWVQSQQANTGLGLDLHKNKYVTTSWDVISIGHAGLNVAKGGPGDYFDFGPLLSAANRENPRYGALPLIHFGNIWDRVTGSLPDSVASHVSAPLLPDVSAGLGFFQPDNGILRTWQWKKDTQLVIVYRYGGS